MLSRISIVSSPRRTTRSCGEKVRVFDDAICNRNQMERSERPAHARNLDDPGEFTFVFRKPVSTETLARAIDAALLKRG